MKREAGFYWARRKDGGELTVIQFYDGLAGPGWMLIGVDIVLDENAAMEHFEILEQLSRDTP
jgi:hypothetical protein